MRIVYWARVALARQSITSAVAPIEGVQLQIVERLSEVLDALPGAEGLVLYNSDVAQAQPVMDRLKAPGNTVRWMHFVTAGREGYEELGWPAGVEVTYAGGGVSPTVAEHAMALLLALVRRVAEIVSVTARGTWDRSLVARTTSLEGGTMAIVGWGHIGRELAKRARPFGMRIVTASRTLRDDPLVDRAYALADLHDCLGQADVVVVTIALTPETTRLIDRAALQHCRPGALFLNVARGGVVDQEALAAALVSGRLGGAAVDVTEPEPLPDGHPFWSTPNLIVSPHVAGAGSAASVERLGRGVAENLRRLLAGEPLQHLVWSG